MLFENMVLLVWLSSSDSSIKSYEILKFLKKLCQRLKKKFDIMYIKFIYFAWIQTSWHLKEGLIKTRSFPLKI